MTALLWLLALPTLLVTVALLMTSALRAYRTITDQEDQA